MINETDKSQVAEFSVLQMQPHALLHLQQFGYNFKFILDYFKKIHILTPSLIQENVAPIILYRVVACDAFND